MTPFRRLTIFAGLADLLLLAAAVGLYVQFDQQSYLIMAVLAGILLASKLIGYAVVRSTGREDLGVILYGLVYSLVIVLPVVLFTDYWWVGAVLCLLLFMLPWLGGQPQLAAPLTFMTLISAALMLVLDIWLVTGERMSLVRNSWLAALLAIGYVALVLLPGLFSFSRLGEEKTGVFPRLLIWFLGVAALAIAIVMGVILLQATLLQQRQIGENNLNGAIMHAERVGKMLEEQVNTLQLLWHSDTLVDAINAANTAYGSAMNNPGILRDLRETNNEWRTASVDSEFVGQYLLNEEAQALTRFANSYPDYLTLIVTDKVGALVAATGGKPDTFFYGDLAWWQTAAQDGDGVYIGNLTQDPQTGAYTVLVASVVKDPATVGEGADPDMGEMIGILVSTLDLSAVQLSFQTSFTGFEGQMGLIGPEGQLIAAADRLALQTAWDKFPISNALSNQASEARFVSGAEGERMLVAHTLVKSSSGQYQNAFQDLGWQVVALQLDSSILTNLNRVLQISALAGVLAMALAVLASWRAAEQVRRPLNAFGEAVQTANQGNLDQKLLPGGLVEWNQLSERFNQMLALWRQSLADKDRQVETSTAMLEERTQQIQAAAEVGRSAVSILNADELIYEVVRLIRGRFGLYYVGLFLVDESGEWAVLRAGTGEAGRIMQERGHRIRVGQGMIGWSVANQQARVAGEAGADAVRLATAELPETRAEAALPLTSRGRVIGALTVQSVQEGFFTPSTVTVLQTMADQVAVALDNANLFAESQAALDALRRSYGEVGRKEWAAMTRTRAIPGYASDEQGIYPVTKEETEKRQKSIQAGGIEIPVRLRDQVLGTLKAAKSKGEDQWTEDEVAMLETMADQLSVALENARLYESTQRRAERERILSDITGKVRASTDINAILQTAIQELADALRVSRGKIQLHQAGIDGGDGGDSDD